jgi:hypothetical protein
MSQPKSLQFASLPLVGLESLESDSELSSSKQEQSSPSVLPLSGTVGESSTDRRSDDDENLLNRSLRKLEPEGFHRGRCAFESSVSPHDLVVAPWWEVASAALVLLMLGVLLGVAMVLQW